MNNRWSASRFGTWLGCKQKYKLVYNDELVVIGRDAEVATKGLAFHEIAEHMDSTKTEADLYEMAKEVLGTKDFDQEKYPVIKAIPRFYMWWQEYVKKYEDQGYTLYRENWENSKLDDKPLVGAIDVLLINEKTKDVRIYDYKTGSTAKIAGYENQLLLYVYMIAKRLGISDYSKLQTYLFFPLAGLKDENNEDPKKTTEKMMLKTMKQLIFTEQDVNDVITNFKNIINETESIDWDKWDAVQNATMSFACSFCSFVGHSKHCPLSYASNCRFPRKAVVMTKEEAKKLATK
jgi:hypothetical protein